LIKRGDKINDKDYKNKSKKISIVFLDLQKKYKKLSKKKKYNSNESSTSS